MAKKLIEEEVIEEVVTPEEVVPEVVTIEEVVAPEAVIETPEVVEVIELDEVLKSNWREILHNSLATIGSSHLEKNAILPLINGLIK